MCPGKRSTYESCRFLTFVYSGTLLGVAALLGLMHLALADVKAGGVWWFNLDKERNIATWFSGALLFLFGSAAITAYYWEKRRNAEGEPLFRLPILWLGVGLIGLLMSLDEITILHENLLWREIRLFSESLGYSWIYVTQWQILFAPAIILILGYFVIFFYNRFGATPGVGRTALTGIGCWIMALFLEGLRGAFKLEGRGWYSLEALIEEELEMVGMILLLASVTLYCIDVALDFTPERRNRLKQASRFLTRRALALLVATLLVLSAAGGTIYVFAQKQATSGAPLPKLHKRAKREYVKARSGSGDGDTGFNVSSYEVWFEDIKTPISITDPEGEALIEFVRTSVSHRKERAGAIPAALRGDVSPRIVFLSVSDGRAPPRVLIGSGKGIGRALEHAVSQVDDLVGRGYDPRWIKLDIVKDSHPIRNAGFDRPYELERSLQGLAFDRQYGIAFLPEELVAYTLVNRKQRIRLDNIESYLRRKFSPAEGARVVEGLRSSGMYRFTTLAFFSDGEDTVRLYRGHRLIDQFSGEDLLSAAARGGRYLTEAVSREGRFIYSYLPKTDGVSDRYNILRHAGTVYAMLELYEAIGEPNLLGAAKRAIEYLLLQIKPCGEGRDTLCVVESGYIKLGGSALAAIALAKYTEVTRDPQYLPVLLRLGGWILSVQKEDGEFFPHKQAYPDGEIADFTSQYYPGEALLALVRIHSLDTGGRWLDAAEKGAGYLIDIRDGGLPDHELNHDHWLLYALNELYRYRPKPLYLKHALRIANAITESQNRDPAYPDWRGSYYRPPRSTPTATRTEGLIAAYLLARDFSEPAEAERIFDAIRFGIGFQLQTQFRPESAMYLKDPQRSLGAFHRSLTDFESRIDYIQHNISSLLGLYRIIGEEGLSTLRLD